MPFAPSDIMRHGGDIEAAAARYGIAAKDWLDLSTGINPRAYPLPNLSETDWTRLPQTAALDQLIAAARTAYAVPDHLAIAAVPGTQAAIQWLPILTGADSAAILSPTYSEHARSYTTHGVTFSESADLDAVLAHPTAILVNPNNPDGSVIASDRLLDALRSSDACRTLIVDESFADCDPGSSIVPRLENERALVLRSFGKFFGLAGLRLGFVIGAPEYVARLSTLAGPWAVSGPALAVGTAALTDRAWIEVTRQWLASEGAALDTCLSDFGLEPLGSVPLFRLVADSRARLIHEHLASRGIWTRVFDYAPEWIRFGLPPSAKARARIADALGSLPGQ